MSTVDDVWERLLKAAQDEIDRLRGRIATLEELARCGCGDPFTKHDPGTCGNCVAALTTGIK